MPNIEIYGVDKPGVLKSSIDKKMQEIGLGDEAITVIYSHATPEACDGTGKVMPFLRLCVPDRDELNKVVDAIREMKLGLDVETLVLDSFIPSEKMK